MTDILYRHHRDSRLSRRRRRLPTGEVIEARGVIASSIALAALAASATAGGAAASSAIQAHASGKAAKLQTDAANRAGDLQDAATQRAEVFQRQQAENDFLNSEAARHANYDQYMGRRSAASALGSSIGFTLPDAPAYVPGIDPHYTTAGTSAPPSANGAPAQPGANGQPASGSIDPTKGDLGAQISAYFKSRGVSDQETPYWVGKWPELVARGQELKDPTYAMKRLAAADIFGGGPRGSAPLAGRSVSSYLPAPSVASMPAPTADFKLRSINAFLS